MKMDEYSGLPAVSEYANDNTRATNTASNSFQVILAIALALLFVILFTLGSFIGCYNMIGGSSAWCEPIVAKMGW